MITATVTGDWKKKLEDLKAEIAKAGSTTASIRPTQVLALLSRRAGRNVLEPPQAVADAAKRSIVPLVEHAIVGRSQGWERRAAAVWRRWAELFVAGVYQWVSAGGLGGVAATTVARKARAGAPAAYGVRDGWLDVQLGKATRGRRSDHVEATPPIVVKVGGREV